MRTLPACLMLFFAAALFAQENPPAPPAPADSGAAKRISAHPLPAIDLPEFVIMGSEKVSFAQSHKQLIELYRSERFTQRTAVGTREMNISTETPTSTATLLRLSFGRTVSSRHAVRHIVFTASNPSLMTARLTVLICFDAGLQETTEWYRRNTAWVEHLRSGEYLSYYDRMYRQRPQTLAER